MAIVGALAMVGVTARSMRSMTPRSSRPRKRSSGEVASAAAAIVSAAMPRKTAGSGCTTARLNIQGSRGRIQQIASGSTPFCSSQMQASVAVFPDPTITYCSGGSSTRARSLTGITRAPSSTAKGGSAEERNGRRKVAGVDDPGPGRSMLRAAQTRTEAPVAGVLAPGEEGHPPGGEERLHDPRVVDRDLRGGRPFMQAGLRPGRLNPSCPEERGRHTVERRGLVEPHEGVGVEPVPAGRDPSIDDRDGGVRVVHERVGEGHPHGSRPDHHVVDVHLDRHRPITATGCAAVKSATAEPMPRQLAIAPQRSADIRWICPRAPPDIPTRHCRIRARSRGGRPDQGSDHEHHIRIDDDRSPDRRRARRRRARVSVRRIHALFR